MRNGSESFEEFSFWLPQVWAYDWEGIIQGAEGVEQGLLAVQTRAANLLHIIDHKNKTVIAARLARLNLWTKALPLGRNNIRSSRKFTL